MFHVAASRLLGVLALNIAFTFGTNQHLICKAVDDVFSDGSSPSHTRTTPRLFHGPPGKRGQTGVKGEPGISGLKGEKGAPGFVDPENIENVVEEKCRQANRELRGRIEELEEVVTRMNSSITGITDIAGRLRCSEGFLYEWKCYFAIIRHMPHSSYGVSLQNAQDLCSKKGGIPADILNLEHQRLFAHHVRSVTTTINYTSVWLGMSYTYSTRTLRWSTGIKVPEDVVDSIRWWSTAPYLDPRRDRVAFSVDSNTFGIIDITSTTYRQGVACERL